MEPKKNPRTVFRVRGPGIWGLLDSAGHRTRANDEPEYEDESKKNDENRRQAASGNRRRNAGSGRRTRHVLTQMLRRGARVVKLLSTRQRHDGARISAILEQKCRQRAK